jgi:hypothetical protein
MVELSCIVLKPDLPERFLFFFDLFSVLDEEASTRSFYSSMPDSYNETRGPTDSLKIVETLYNI